MTTPEINRDTIKKSSDTVKEDLNADPITGEPGSHPLTTGLGSASGAAAGAAIGSVAGPLGTLVGGAVGAIIGAVAGHNAGEALNPTEEDSYWREHSATTDYFGQTRSLYADVNYDKDYQTAYRIGYENRPNYKLNTSFSEVEQDLRIKWEAVKGESRLTWDQAKYAVRDAWDRVSNHS